MSKDFEKFIKQKILGIEPKYQSDIWERISNDLDNRETSSEKRKKRYSLFFILNGYQKKKKRLYVSLLFFYGFLLDF
jgi:hypothetical protein